VGDKQNQPFQLSLNASLKVDFQGSRVLWQTTAWNGISPNCCRARWEDGSVAIGSGRTRCGNWSLTSLQQRLVKTGGRWLRKSPRPCATSASKGFCFLEGLQNME